MGWKGENPENVYQRFDHSGITIYLDKEDCSEQTQSCAKFFCQHQNYSPLQVKGFYNLRGHTKQVIYSRVLVGVLETQTLPPELFEVVHCLTFWNQEGADCYMMNAENQESYSDFILKCIAADCRAFVEPCADRFITGKGGNHVWVSHKESGKRILFIHF